MDLHGVVDREPQADIVDGVAGLQFATISIGRLRERFDVDQPRLDFPEAVVPDVAVALDRSRVHRATPGSAGGFSLGHRVVLNQI